MGLVARIDKFCLLRLKLPFETVVLSLVAIVVVTASIYLDGFFPNKNFFARSGSILVLLGATASYRQLVTNLEERLNQFSEPQDDEELAQLLQMDHRILGRSRVIEIALILLGTFIWGYGDLLF